METPPMMVAGIDLSTRAIDIVKVPLEHGRPPVWHRFPLTGSDSFDRARSVRDAMPCRTSVFWDDVLGCGVEDPRGQSPGHIYRVQGAVLACLPPHLLVHPLVPSEWRRLVGLKGNASKETVYAKFVTSFPIENLVVSQDAVDAYCIALSTRDLITRQKAAA